MSKPLNLDLPLEFEGQWFQASFYNSGGGLIPEPFLFAQSHKCLPAPESWELISELKQAPGSKIAHGSGDGQMTIKPFRLDFEIQCTTYNTAVIVARYFQIHIPGASSVKLEAVFDDPDGNTNTHTSWRALVGSHGDPAIKYSLQSMGPIRWVDLQASRFIIPVTLLPKFALWTTTRADTKTDYDAAEKVIVL